jgi:MFS family permease
MGVGSLVGALVSPAAGWAGDRVGFRPVLIGSLALGGAASLLMPAAPGLWLLAGASVLLGAAVATTGAMVMSLLATEVPAERRSATLNLVYLPLYIAGIIGPAVGSGIATAIGPGGPFIAGGIVFLGGALFIGLRRGRTAGGSPDRTAVPETPTLR